MTCFSGARFRGCVGLCCARTRKRGEKDSLCHFLRRSPLPCVAGYAEQGRVLRRNDTGSLFRIRRAPVRLARKTSHTRGLRRAELVVDVHPAGRYTPISIPHGCLLSALGSLYAQETTRLEAAFHGITNEGRRGAAVKVGRRLMPKIPAGRRACHTPSASLQARGSAVAAATARWAVLPKAGKPAHQTGG